MLNTQKTTHPSYAFFDVDETLISIKSMFSFIDIYFSKNPNPSLEKSFHNDIKTLITNNTDRSAVNARYYSYFQHFSVSSVNDACRIWFELHVSDPSFYHPHVVERLKQHQSLGVPCVFVSGSFTALLKAIAKDLNVEHILCINLEVDELMYTGRIIPPQTIGNGKAKAVSAFLSRQGGDPSQCFAYGDDISDSSMLELVGFPCAIRGEKRLEEYAHRSGWEIINPYPMKNE
jgi:HAD superfamily hydrolase (TIGR01490 family)